MVVKRRNLYATFLTSAGDVYFDVGANYGNRIAPLMGMGIKVIAVEPQEKCIRFLKAKYGDKITIVPKGLGASEGVETLYISNAHTISSFSKDWIKATQESGRFSQYNWNKEQKIEMTTLDVLVDIYGRPKFIKIDVEGFEYEVLKGLSSPVAAVSFEYTVPEKLQSVSDCINRIVEISNGSSVEFNYSIGESMEWALSEWLSPRAMEEEIGRDEFIATKFGDIYARTLISDAK